jgi:hypothetical protein
LQLRVMMARACAGRPCSGTLPETLLCGAVILRNDRIFETLRINKDQALFRYITLNMEAAHLSETLEPKNEAPWP